MTINVFDLISSIVYLNSIYLFFFFWTMVIILELYGFKNMYCFTCLYLKLYENKQTRLLVYSVDLSDIRWVEKGSESRTFRRSVLLSVPIVILYTDGQFQTHSPLYTIGRVTVYDFIPHVLYFSIFYSQFYILHQERFVMKVWHFKILF